MYSGTVTYKVFTTISLFNHINANNNKYLIGQHLLKHFSTVLHACLYYDRLLKPDYILLRIFERALLKPLPPCLFCFIYSCWITVQRRRHPHQGHPHSSGSNCCSTDVGAATRTKSDDWCACILDVILIIDIASIHLWIHWLVGVGVVYWVMGFSNCFGIGPDLPSLFKLH